MSKYLKHLLKMGGKTDAFFWKVDGSEPGSEEDIA